MNAPQNYLWLLWYSEGIQTWADCEQPPVQGSDSALMCSLAHTLQHHNNLTFVIEVHFNNAAISWFTFYHFPGLLFEFKT